MHINYMKLQVIEGLIIQIRNEQENCNLTLKVSEELLHLSERIESLMIFFEEGDRHEQTGGVDQGQQEEAQRFTDKILIEMQKVTWS